MSSATTPALTRPLRAGITVLLATSLLAGIAVCLFAGDPFSVWFFIGYAIPASLLLLRRPRNIIGWLLLAIGWALCLASLTVRASPAALSGGELSVGDSLVVWSSVWSQFAILPLVMALAILFPDGRLPRGKWRALAVVVLVAALLLVLFAAFRPVFDVTVSENQKTISVRNPFALFPTAPFWSLLPVGDVLGSWFISAALWIAPVVLLARFVRSTGLERLRLQWLVATVVFLAAATILGALLEPLAGTIAWLPLVIALPAIPAAITVAVLRYRLYDIDALINRTVLYGTVTLILGGLFGLANVGAQRLLEELTHQRSDLVTAGLAVGAALAFTPISRRMRPLADRLLPSRALLTLLFVDIVESTRKAVQLGDEQWRALLGRYRSAIRREIGRFGGREVDTAGDGFFVTFEQPDPAVECALAVRSAVQRLGLETRIGLHLGECETRGEKVSGIAVHAAARVMSAAGSGEVLISEAVREVLASSELVAVDRGAHELKGVPGRWQLYALDAHPPPASGS
jgi:class 3 adenylate cyclase